MRVNTAVALSSLFLGWSLAAQQEIMQDDIPILHALGTDGRAMRTIVLGPEETKVVAEVEKWALKRKGIKFMDITDHPDLGHTVTALKKKTYKYPSKPQHQDVVKPLLAKLEKGNMEKNLEKFTSFYTRYFRSSTGRESGEWLLGKVNETISVYDTASVKPFIHSWGQNSVIAHIPPSSDKKTDDHKESDVHVVIGAHQDSANYMLPMYLRSPGADDDGSGTVTILEALRVIAKSGIKLKNPLEFQWYSAEEGGLLGSQAIFADYEKRGVKVGAMLQQDMTGFVKKTVDSGAPVSVGVITDYVDPDLTKFIKTIIEEYCDIPYVDTQCGYACSDHASASKAGYPSAFIIESSFENSNDHIHTTADTIDRLDFDHMLQHAKLTLALAVELALADL